LRILEKTAKAIADSHYENVPGEITLFMSSIAESGQSIAAMVEMDNTRYIMITGNGALLDEMKGTPGNGYLLCPLSTHNRLVLNRHFPFTCPVARGRTGASIGLGDRLGIATPGHIKAVQNRDVFPVFAQQSIRELNLTGRTYTDVLDDAAFAVFQEGYKKGYGADADHLKDVDDIKSAIDLGFSMITLDCSDHINQDVSWRDASSTNRLYKQVPDDLRHVYERRYLDKTFEVGNGSLTYTGNDLAGVVLTYHRALQFIIQVYEQYIKDTHGTIDFEISIDETQTPTTPLAHYLIANELCLAKVACTSLAPRFCGEFQKGIDYMGDIRQFESDLTIHAAIADHFGYRLSIHSGSDKFSVFPLIGSYTSGRFHVKTAGTNWLEAVRVIASKNPSLYREMHQYALDNFHEAVKYYHVGTKIEDIAPLDTMKDSALVDYMNDPNARQLMHITYGILLQSKNDTGEYLFRDRIFQTLTGNYVDYKINLMNHIGKHLELLGIQ